MHDASIPEQIDVPPQGEPATPGVTRHEDLYCPQCGYNLRSLVSDRCPECALEVAFIRSATSLLPWVDRQRLGRLRAYLMTVWLVVFRTQRFCLEMCRPVDERHARAFRRTTVFTAFLPFPVFTCALAWIRPDGFDALLEFGGMTFVVVAHVAALAAMLSLTGVPYYVIRHREVELARQLRAATLSLYCGAPLSMMGLAVALAIGGVIVSHLSQRNWDLLLYALAAGVFMVIMVVALFDVQRVIRWMLRETGTALPINARLCGFWALSIFLSLVALPVITMLAEIMIYSLRS